MTSTAATKLDAGDLDAARRGDAGAFERLIDPDRTALLGHCYRMLGSAHDAEDALQETLLRAWRGMSRFEGRSSLRSWLYRIATNVSLRMIERRPKRVIPVDYGPPTDPHDSGVAPTVESVWLDPYPDEALGVDGGPPSPEARYEQRESVELGFLAALQHLPPRQRAVLLLRDVLGFAPGEIAEVLDASPASIYSALQRAHRAVEERFPARSQQATLRSIGDEHLRELVNRYMEAWDEGDIAAILAMLTDDASFSMPPRSSWYRGRSAIGPFLAAKPLSRGRRWRRIPIRANGQLAFGVYGPGDGDGRYLAHAIEVLTLDPDGRISDVTAFLEPTAFARFGMRDELRQ
jgi:RNA polymerase sigma-70 factor (ECF subfamily)